MGSRLHGFPCFPYSVISMACFFARAMLDLQLHRPMSRTRKELLVVIVVDKCIGDLSSNESRSFRDRRFLGLILWNSLWGEFISIPKEVIGMATTCKDKSRAVPKVIRSGV